MKLDSSFEELESGEYPESSVKSSFSEIITRPERPESPDVLPEDLNQDTNSGKFIIEGHKLPSRQSITSVSIAIYPEQVAQEGADSYSVNQPGPVKK